MNTDRASVRQLLIPTFLVGFLLAVALFLLGVVPFVGVFVGLGFTLVVGGFSGRLGVYWWQIFILILYLTGSFALAGYLKGYSSGWNLTALLLQLIFFSAGLGISFWQSRRAAKKLLH